MDSAGTFPAPEPILPNFCCAEVEPKDQEYMSKLDTNTTILQYGRLSNFVEYMAEYCQSNAVPVNEDLKWGEKVEYVVKVLRYRQKNVAKSAARKNRKVKRAKGDGKGKEEGEGEKVEWEQTSPGRYFVETRHERGQRWPNHRFDEVLITEMEDVEGFERIERVEMEFGCEVHKEVRWRCESWMKTDGE
jgi:hypothetical protein